MNTITLADRMKTYEDIESRRILIPNLPVMIRLDGKNFSSYTKGLKRPFDQRLTDLMIATTKYIVEESNAIVGFTGSDEITLVLYSESSESQIYYDGRIQKLTSILAAKTSVYFNSKVSEYLPEKADKLVVFDCRVWNVPSIAEATNAVMSRELDVTRNAISMAAQNLYSHKELQNKNSSELQEMVFQKGINFNDYPACFKRGTYIRKVKTLIPFSPEEIDKLPLKHAARKNPNLLIERSVVKPLELPPLRSIVNKVDVLFKGSDPI